MCMWCDTAWCCPIIIKCTVNMHVFLKHGERAYWSEMMYISIVFVACHLTITQLLSRS